MQVQTGTQEETHANARTDTCKRARARAHTHTHTQGLQHCMSTEQLDDIAAFLSLHLPPI